MSDGNLAWRIRAADLDDERRWLSTQLDAAWERLDHAQARIKHLEELIVTFGMAEASWFRPISECTSETTRHLAAAEVALRDEAFTIRHRTEDPHA